MTILITSGGHLARLLYAALKDVHDVRVLRRRPDPAFGASCVVGDVARLDDVVRAMEGCDRVFHTAVRNNTDVELRSYEEFHGANVDGTFHVFLAAQRLGTPRVIHSSTSMVLPFHVIHESMRPGEGAATRIGDDTPRRGTDIYGLTKLVGEMYADYFRQRYGMSIISLRYGWLAPLHLYRDPVMIYNTLSGCFHPEDALAANLLVMDATVTGNYLICAPPAFEEGDAEDLWQRPAAVLAHRFPDEAAYLEECGFTPTPIASWLDCSRAMAELGYRPRFGFADFVRMHRAGAFPEKAG